VGFFARAISARRAVLDGSFVREILGHVGCRANESCCCAIARRRTIHWARRSPELEEAGDEGHSHERKNVGDHVTLN